MNGCKVLVGSPPASEWVNLQDGRPWGFKAGTLDVWLAAGHRRSVVGEVAIGTPGAAWSSVVGTTEGVDADVLELDPRIGFRAAMAGVVHPVGEDWRVHLLVGGEVLIDTIVFDWGQATVMLLASIGGTVGPHAVQGPWQDAPGILGNPRGEA